MKTTSGRTFLWGSVLLSCVLGSVAWSQAAPTDAVLIAALRAGGHVLVMRHAHSPRQAPAVDAASKDNPELERELDEAGRASATAMGEALRGLQVRMGKVYVSPTFRAMQTARLAQLPTPEPVAALGDRSGADGAAWLRTAAGEAPVAGANTILITHAPNVMGAFAEQGQGMSDGEMLVVRPDGAGSYVVVGRIPIERWPGLVATGGKGSAARAN